MMIIIKQRVRPRAADSWGRARRGGVGGRSPDQTKSCQWCKTEHINIMIISIIIIIISIIMIVIVIISSIIMYIYAGMWNITNRCHGSLET